MIIIAAMTRDRVIGSGSGLPWHVPDDYEQFLRFIDGQTVIIGRRSFDIFGSDLTSAHTLVVSRSGAELPGGTVCSSLDEALEKAAAFGKTTFSAGGATLYEQTLPLAEAMYLSFIKGDYQGDAYFPAFDGADWTVEARRDHPAFEFVVYRRKAVTGT